LGQANGWVDAALAPRAIGFLRGEAADWFNKAAKRYYPAEYTAALTSWTAFLALFKPRFFTKAAAADIAADWYLLRQQEHESAAAFIDRTTATISDYVELLPGVPAANDEVDKVLTDADCQVGGGWTATADERRGLRAAIATFAATHATRVTDVRFNAVILTVFANGLRNPVFAQKARLLLREGKTLVEIRDAIINLDRANVRPVTTDNRRPQQQQPPTSSRPAANGQHNGKPGQHAKAMATTTLPTDGDDAETLAANAAGHGRGRGRGRGGRGRGSGRGGRAAGQLPPRACYLCPDQWHWREDCPRSRVAAAETPSGNGPAGN
jgi:hypothetical protein